MISTFFVKEENYFRGLDIDGRIIIRNLKGTTNEDAD
jgi:hypothetical protein